MNPPSLSTPHPSGGSRKRLLGQLLVDGEFISRVHLDRALEEQKRSNELLGEVLVRMGVLDAEDLGAVLSVQAELSTLSDAMGAAGGVRKLLGELFLEAKRITPAQLAGALEEQARTGAMLGEVFVRRKLVTAPELEAALEFQKRQEQDARASERFRLGNILVAAGIITGEQLDRALSRQKQRRKKIGELLVEAGDVTPRQVAKGLSIQKKIATAALVAVLSLADAAGARDVFAGRAQAPPGSATIAVTAAVSPRATMRVLRQNPVVVVTEVDVARGYVDVREASTIEVSGNSPAGYVLMFESLGGPPGTFGEVDVRGLGRQVQLSAGGGWVVQPSVRGTVTMELSYRFALGKEARPGSYRWPLSVSILPR